MSDVNTMSDFWSKLPQDLLRLLVDRYVVSEKEFLCLRSVCRDWRSALPKSCWKRTPWLLARRYQTPNVVIKGLDSLCSSHGSLSSLFVTDLSWRYWGSFTGWILGQNHSDYTLKLINPLTKAVIDLPMLHHYLGKGVVYHAPGSDPRNPVIGVMAVSHSFSGIAMIDNEYKEWTFLKDKRYVSNSDFKDLIWYKDNVAAVRGDGEIVFFDEKRVVRSFNPKRTLVREYYDHYLVESSGDLLIVAYVEHRYEVYRLNLKTGGWIRVWDLGRHSLFVGKSYSMSHWISADTTGDSWRPSCIYNATYSPTGSCHNIAKKQEEFHDVSSFDGLNKCFDFIWYMPAVGSN
ncbi:hypothetical protein ACET3Z_002273 [Daucus carota]